MDYDVINYIDNLKNVLIYFDELGGKIFVGLKKNCKTIKKGSFC